MNKHTPGSWNHQLQKAQFEELVWRDGTGWRMPLWHVPYDRSLKKLKVEASRRWWVGHPLTRQWDRVDEAIEATRRTRA